MKELFGGTPPFFLCPDTGYSCTVPLLCYNVPAMVTKRHLGIIVIVLGGLAILGVVGVDLVGAGKWGGFGPLQRMVVGLCGVAIVVGCILFRLGDRPA